MIAVKGVPSIDPFVRQPAITVNGRHVTRGTELTITGLRGRVRFVEHVTNPTNGKEWVAVIDKRGHARSFPPDAIVRVHRTTTTRENQR